jgi:hypothetical protein
MARIIICQWDYPLTIDGNKTQLPSRITVGLAWDGWILTQILAVTPAMANYRDQHCALRVAQLTYDEVDRLFFSISEI